MAIGELDSTLHASVNAVEQRVARILIRSRQAVGLFLSGQFDDEWPQVSYAEIEAEPLTGIALSRFAPFWRDLVPKTPETLAQLCQELGNHYTVDTSDPDLREVLGLDEARVVAASLEQFGQTPDELLTRRGPESEPEPRPGVDYLGIYAAVANGDLEWVMLPQGSTLFRQGDHSDALYIIVSGRLQVLAEYEGAPARVLTELGPGELAGEMAVFTGRPRSATVEVLSDCELVRLTKHSFERLLELHPLAMMSIIRLLVNRLERREQTLVKKVMQLTIEIDETKRAKDVNQIAGLDIFRSLQDRAGQMRARRAAQQNAQA